MEYAMETRNYHQWTEEAMVLALLVQRPTHVFESEDTRVLTFDERLRSLV